MNIELHYIPIREVVDGYFDNSEQGCRGFGGKLNIRPPYQREFVYKNSQRVAVIDSIRKNFPLNVMYWVDDGDGTFELLDGQQRTLSICQYVHGEFAFNKMYFNNLTAEEKNSLLDYKNLLRLPQQKIRNKIHCNFRQQYPSSKSVRKHSIELPQSS